MSMTHPALLVRKVKPNFKLLGPRFGKNDEGGRSGHPGADQDEIAEFEKHRNLEPGA